MVFGNTMHFRKQYLGVKVVSVSNTGVTLTTGNGAADQARKSGLKLEGTLTADVTVAIPAQEKIYFVHNGTTGEYNILFKAGSGTAVTATESGKSMMIATDGTTINLFKNEDNDSKIFSNFLVPNAITANGAVDTSATKSIYQRVNTGANDVTVSVSTGGLGIGQYVIIDKVTTTNIRTICLCHFTIHTSVERKHISSLYQSFNIWYIRHNSR